MKKLLNAFIFTAIIMAASSCKKDEVATPAAAQNNGIRKEATDGYQNVVVNDKLFSIRVKGNPDNPDDIQFVDCPAEVENFIKTYEQTLIPHVVMGEKETYVFYYKDVDDLYDHVQFADGKKVLMQHKSLNGARVSQHNNYNRTGGTISDLNSTYTWFQPLPTRYNAIYAYGKLVGNIGSAMNDKVSLIDFEMKNGDEPITYIGYENAYEPTCHCGFAGHMLILTKLKATQTGIGQNSAQLWNIKMTWLRNWNDKISAYDFFQSPTTLNVGLTIR